jgi:uncharacterized protein
MTKIPTLLLTGANNHDWSRSAPFCEDLLEQSGRFAVTLTESPHALLADGAALRKYRLFFLDYNGPQWDQPERANFETCISEGAGLVVLHAADNAFPGWVEYEKMVGLLWRQGTGHGDYHQFKVTIADPKHPITAGIEDFLTSDELYHNLIHLHGVPYQVLATAYSDPATRGTGRHEPMMVVTRYGRGRVYHHVLGHVWKGDPQHQGSTLAAFESPGFQKTLLRGCEWAATGQVTL